MQGDERVHDHLFGGAGVARQQCRQPDQRPVVRVVQIGQGGAVVLLRAGLGSTRLAPPWPAWAQSTVVRRLAGLTVGLAGVAHETPTPDLLAEPPSRWCTDRR